MKFSDEIEDDLRRRPFTVFVEGNVGSGKTSFLNYLKKFDEFLVLEEPIDKWKNLHGCNLLDLKFNQPERFQFTFQTYATLTRLKQHLQPSEKPIKIMERSLFTARNCFVENLYDNGKLDDGMYHVLSEWYDFVNETHPIRCDLIVYLKTSPDVAYQRVLDRAREEEAALTFKYLEQLHDRHESLLYTSPKMDKTILYTVDANKTQGEIKEEYHCCYEEIKHHYKKSKDSLPNRSESIIRI